MAVPFALIVEALQPFLNVDEQFAVNVEEINEEQKYE